VADVIICAFLAVLDVTVNCVGLEAFMYMLVMQRCLGKGGLGSKDVFGIG
jgi:hypothetical protein